MRRRRVGTAPARPREERRRRENIAQLTAQVQHGIGGGRGGAGEDDAAAAAAAEVGDDDDAEDATLI